MRKLVCLACIILFISTLTNSQPVWVTGKVENGNGLMIRAMAYLDHLTNLKETLASDLIDPDGNFNLSFEITETRYIWLDISFQQAELFVQPSRKYEIEINLVNQMISTSYYNRLGLPLTIVRDDPDKLNLYIQDFNQLYNDFLLSYSENIALRNSTNAFDIFKNAAQLRFQNAVNPYFLNYMQYKMAAMQLFLRLKSRESIGIEYLAGKPVLHENVEYMDFFQLFFEKYFLTGGKYFNYSKSFDLINANAKLETILDEMAADPALQQPEVRELLLLLGLKEMYSSAGFNKQHILFLINELAHKAVADKNRMIAANLLTRLNHLQLGSPAPDFKAMGVMEEKDYRLEDFRGKYLYLAFFDSGNPASRAELEMIDESYDEFRNKVGFVAISVDSDMNKLRKYVEDRNLNWQVLHYGGNLDLLDNYDAITFPQFFIIDRDGSIVLSPAPSPSENIRRLFESL